VQAEAEAAQDSTMTPEPRQSEAFFAPCSVQIMRRADGCTLLRSTQKLGEYGRCVGDWLQHWATAAPERPFLLERDQHGSWTGVTYSEALQQVRRIAAWLLSAECSAERPVAILSDNSVRHGLLAIASMHVGVPVASVSSAYSLMSTDFGKLKTVIAQLTPGALYVSDVDRFAPALSAVCKLHDAAIMADRPQVGTGNINSWSEILNALNDEAVQRAFDAVGPDTVAKLLFTSGSTGTPKAVVTTQRMLLVNQQQVRQVWPFMRHHVPVLVDWLPWSHTFGGSHNFNLVLRSGGTLYIDAGRPTPQGFAQTIANLREVAPTLYFNVPRGFDMLLPLLRDDRSFRDHFLSRLELMYCAGAALPHHVWAEIKALVANKSRRSTPIVGAWGSTETAPMATSCHFEAAVPGVIGLPVPGIELKLVPCGPKLEVRVKGPNITPGYLKRPDLTAQAFDDEGFYIIGDAVRPVNPQNFESGLLFDGRVSEDFKLSSGTWVNAGTVRLRAIAALAPLVQDAVVTGHDRDWLGLFLFPNIQACRECCGNTDAPVEWVLSDLRVRNKIKEGLEELRRQCAGSASYAARALLMTEPASTDAGEITDKGYINQRAVLERRAALIETLYAPDVRDDVIEISGWRQR
jgi:feruloyl-CoA synthase